MCNISNKEKMFTLKLSFLHRKNEHVYVDKNSISNRNNCNTKVNFKKVKTLKNSEKNSLQNGTFIF